MSVIRPFKKFTSLDDEVWRLLCEKQLPRVRQHASQLWLDGLKILDLPHDRVPDFAEMNERFKALVGWQLVSTPVVYSDGQDWFEHLVRREFLITEYIREKKDIDYTPLPDIWHDTFGHLPFMVHQRYADYIERFANHAVRYTKDERRSLGSLWWYTIEFGFMMEQPQQIGHEFGFMAQPPLQMPHAAPVMKAFGAGLMSSPGELDHALSDEVEKIPYSLDEFEKIDPSPHVMHNKLFILESFEQLEQSVEDWVARKESSPSR